MNSDLFKKAYRAIHKPLPHIISLYGWNLSTSQCFARAGGTSRQDFGGHQCQKKPKYHIGKIQFCTIHAKEISPSLEGLEEIKSPLRESNSIRIKELDL